MNDGTLWLLGLLALLGGVGVTYLSCLRRGCCALLQPPLEPDTPVRLTVGGKPFSTLFRHCEGQTLWLMPPLQQGLPVSFPEGSTGSLEFTTPSGIYRADIQFIGRRTNPSLIGLQATSAWQYTQRRRSERIPLPDEAQVEIQTGQSQWIGWVQDVSEGGMRMVSPVSLSEGARLRLILPSRLVQSAQFERGARVVACRRAVHRAGYAYTVHLAYTDAP